MLKIHHLRNATMVIETESDVILVDPMLGEKGSMTTFTYLRFKAMKNPIVDLPECNEILERVTHCLITHKHPDHIDGAGIRFLREKNTPITCSKLDEIHFKSKGLNVVLALDYNNKTPFLDGSITGIKARHGYGFIAKPMGNVMGFYIELPKQKTIYLSSDTVYTPEVENVLKKFKPQIAVVAGGTAQLDLFKPLLMTMEDILKFVKNAPETVIANHLEAVNHCPTSRKALKTELEKNGLHDKVHIPLDGEIIKIN